MAEDINTFLSAFQRVKEIRAKKPNQRSWQCCCPAHRDETPSLTITDDTASSGKILLHCHANCRAEDILSAVGKDWSAVNPEEENRIPPKWHIKYDNGYKYEFVTAYSYRDLEGHYLYSKIRYENKDLHKKIFSFGKVNNRTKRYELV